MVNSSACSNQIVQNGKTTNDVTIENSHDEEVFQDSAPDDPLQQSHLNRLEENFVVVKNIIAHEQEKLHEMTSSQRESLLYKGADPKTTAFRIRTNNANVTQVPNARVSPTKQGAPNYRGILHYASLYLTFRWCRL